MPDWVSRLRTANVPGRGRFASTQPTRFVHKFKRAESELTLNTAAVRLETFRYGKAILGGLADRVVYHAKLNTLPGRGPGPHPHRTDTGWEHEDTGNLSDAIMWNWEEDTVYTFAQTLVYVDAEMAPYGHWLELGWHGPSGAFYRYPFILPAAEAVAQESDAQRIQPDFRNLDWRAAR
jgi:hypothetical protein